MLDARKRYGKDTHPKLLGILSLQQGQVWLPLMVTAKHLFFLAGKNQPHPPAMARLRCPRAQAGTQFSSVASVPRV